MTQSSVMEAPAVAAAPVYTPEGGSNRRKLVLGGVLAVAVLGAGGYFLLSGGSSSSPQASGAVPHVVRQVTVPKVAKAPLNAAPKVVVPAVSTVPIGRDPFAPLYVPPPPASAVAPTTTTSGTTTTGTSTTATTTTTPAVTTHSLTLQGVDSGQTATFSVDGKLMVAKVGTVFGPTAELKLLSLAKNSKGVWVATLQAGDSDPMTAPVGQTIAVQ